mmetsp:Transcript_27403/g.64907  ORF Transcript_27403/g.64907 Transcript_27403/m.64907 type:complete len:268 (+) Transcript_27403:177-980(+)
MHAERQLSRGIAVASAPAAAQHTPHRLRAHASIAVSVPWQLLAARHGWLIREPRPRSTAFPSCQRERRGRAASPEREGRRVPMSGPARDKRREAEGGEAHAVQKSCRLGGSFPPAFLGRKLPSRLQHRRHQMRAGAGLEPRRLLRHLSPSCLWRAPQGAAGPFSSALWRRGVLGGEGGRLHGIGSAAAEDQPIRAGEGLDGAADARLGPRPERRQPPRGGEVRLAEGAELLASRRLGRASRLGRPRPALGLRPPGRARRRPEDLPAL